MAKPADVALRGYANHAWNVKTSAGAAMSYRTGDRTTQWHHMAAPASRRFRLAAQGTGRLGHATLPGLGFVVESRTAIHQCAG